MVRTGTMRGDSLAYNFKMILLLLANFHAKAQRSQRRKEYAELKKSPHSWRLGVLCVFA